MKIEKIKNSNTKILGKNIEYYKTIDSTHKYAKSIANTIEQNGKLIISEVQTSGIGTKGRSWHTGENKNIAMTLIIKPKCQLKMLNHLTIDIAEVMRDTIKELYNIELNIKEPNDLILNNKKICGILTESSTTGENINFVLMSLGFNVNETNFNEDIVNIATSLKLETKKEYEREEIISKFLEKLELMIIKYL